MIYKMRINKRIRNIRVYKMLKRSGKRPNLITLLFMKAMAGRGKDEGVQV
jgi:hypothetical protein